MIGRVNTGGSGTGGTLTVTAPAGVTVTAAKDGKTKTKVAGSDGIAVFKGLASGTWTVTINDGSQTAQKVAVINTDYALVISFNTIPEFTYTGDFEIVNDSDEPITTSQDNWKIRLLTSGTLTFTNLNGAANGIDVFCVGGGGNGGAGSAYGGGGGGGGGYTKTNKSVPVSLTSYDIIVGAAGGNTSAFGLDANAGSYGEDSRNNSSYSGAGGSGGSGGGNGGKTNTTPGGDGGFDGSTPSDGGTGQGTTTREFGDDAGKLYAGGGGGGTGQTSGSVTKGGTGGSGGGGKGADTRYGSGTAGTPNTGGGGGGGGAGGSGGSGGSGIVIIRNAREVS